MPASPAMINNVLDFRPSKGNNMLSTAGDPYTNTSASSTASSTASSSGSPLGTVSAESSNYSLPTGRGTAQRDIASYLKQNYQANRQKYDNFLQSMLSARFGEDLVKEVRPTVEQEAAKQRDVTARDLSRYGATLTPVEQQEMDRQSQRQESLALAGGLTNTRTFARDIRQGYLSDLANLGTLIKQGGLQGVMDYEQSKEAGKQALSQNRAAYKSSIFSTIGTAAMIGIMGGF